MRIARGGIQWIIAAFILFLLAFIGSFLLSEFIQNISYFIAILFLALFVLLIIFFRDPDRHIGQGITAVADGVIQEIADLDQNTHHWIRISTFMNIHNVHVNRMPIDGEIAQIFHHPGGYLPAFKKESERNERVEIIAKTRIGDIKIMLIAGTIARRIVPYIQKGDVIKKGERIGLIRLGSRVDVYFPKSSVQVMVVPRERIRAGVDTVATINA